MTTAPSPRRAWRLFALASATLLFLLVLPAADDGFNLPVVISQIVLWAGVSLICGLGLHWYLKS
ncbi:hypothetical protein OLX02_08990 [Novosphingobium sp. KCTC 2891]|uniref:hypothetical protein n=1 Tax=Novosphingobium sp. KCTC 2891 TaxID=2989730 RepID=UPI0022238C02|nr:hypothetical protein [Novosphingobium sp. KCTC 2891]MCW1382958.1 hypothetical protein [Novosphingobium sp. KCTC 2891]